MQRMTPSSAKLDKKRINIRCYLMTKLMGCQAKHKTMIVLKLPL